MAAIMAAVEEFEHLRGFPKTDAGLRGYCKGVYNIVQDQPHIFDKDHPDGWTAQQTLEWLIDECSLHFKFFPSVAEMDEVYVGTYLFRARWKGPTPPECVAEARWYYEHPKAVEGDYQRAMENVRAESRTN